MTRVYRNRSISSHLPFDLSPGSLPTTSPTLALWHGTSWQLSGDDDYPKMSSSPNLAGTYTDMSNAWYQKNSDVTTSNGDHKFGGCPDDRIPIGPYPRSSLHMNDWEAGGYKELDAAIELNWWADAGGTALAWEALPPYMVSEKPNPMWWIAGIRGVSRTSGGAKVCLQVDCPSTLSNMNSTNPGVYPELSQPSAYADFIAPFIVLDGHMRNANGHIPIFAYNPDVLGTSWWTTMFNRLSSQHSIDQVYLCPLFNSSFSTNFNTYKTFMGRSGQKAWCGMWGINTYDGATSQDSNATIVRNGGHSFMRVWAPQSLHTDSGFVYESEGLRSQQELMQHACENRQAGEAIYCKTWNDMSEGGECAPMGATQWAHMDVAAYYHAWFRSGTAPTILRDCLYYSHRLHAWNAKPNAAYQTITNADISGTHIDAYHRLDVLGPAGADVVTVLAFLTAPGNVVIKHGSTVISTTINVPAGVTRISASMPTTSGTLSFQLIRDGETKINFPSAFPIQGAYWNNLPYWQDFKYRCGGSLRYSLSQAGRLAHPYAEPVQNVRSYLKGQARYG